LAVRFSGIEGLLHSLEVGGVWPELLKIHGGVNMDAQQIRNLSRSGISTMATGNGPTGLVNTPASRGNSSLSTLSRIGKLNSISS
jgi:hypothetical protein